MNELISAPANEWDGVVRWGRRVGRGGTTTVNEMRLGAKVLLLWRANYYRIHRGPSRQSIPRVFLLLPLPPYFPPTLLCHHATRNTGLAAPVTRREETRTAACHIHDIAAIFAATSSYG